MASKNGKSAPRNTFTSDIKFVSMRLSGSDADQFRSWVQKQADTVLPRVEEILQSNYKLSASWYGDGDCYITSLTCRESADPNFNLCLSARSSDLFEALALLVFKHDHFCNDHIWEADANDQHWG